MKKRTLSIMLVLCLVMSMFFSIPVFAAGSITLDKTECKPGETIVITAKGVTQDQIDYNANIAYAKDGEKYENFEVIEYVSELDRNDAYEFTAPMEFGRYEIALMDGDMNLIDSVILTVVPPRAKEGDIKIDKTEVKIQEEVAVTINGLTKEMIDFNAFVAICDVDLKNENSMLENENLEYIMYLPRDNTYRFKAPNDFGLYEARVFSTGLHSTDEKEANEKFFGKVSFRVVSSKAKAGDIKLSKDIVRPGEKLSVTVNGLTKGEISNGAWLGIVKSGERLTSTPYFVSIESLPVNNTYEFTADVEPGKYEVRVFCFGHSRQEEEAYYEYGMFGKAEFLVSGDAAPSDEYASGYEGLHSWHVGEVNEAKKENLVTDKVLSEFPKDITREEFCELAVLLYEKMTGKKAEAAANPFTDTKNPEILKAYNLKIVGGIGDGKFAPNNNVTRQEIAAMLVRTLKAAMPNIDTKAEFKTKFQDEKDIGSWAVESVKFMNANDIIKGTEINGVSYILPKGNTTREQAIALVLRIYNQFYKL